MLKFRSHCCLRIQCLAERIAQVNTQASQSGQIVIPARKPRRPTDILQTLSNTVSRDPTAAHFKYHDDPYLIPLSNVGKRAFALAQEAGRKAAKWIVNENASLFKHQVAEPPIEVFSPKAVIDETSKVGEDSLASVINNGLISDAIIIYDLLQKKGVEVSDKTKQSLLELACFTNEEESVPEELIEERWFTGSKRTKQAEQYVKKWKDNGFADTLFKSMTPASAEAYSAMIQGMAKFGQLEKAWELFATARDKGLVLNVGAFNAIIAVGNGLKEGHEMRWQLVTELLTRLSTENIRPNLDTFNSTLHTISTMGGPDSIKLALSTLSEFELLGIKPSLGSYFFILHTITRERRSNVNVGKVMSDILDRLEGVALDVQHASDTRFFVKAMEVCRFNAQDPQLARRVDAVLHHANNYNLIGDSFEESVYYRNFFCLLCATEPTESIMELYNDLVPNIYTPEPLVMQELIKAADLSGSLELLPRFWTDIVAFDQTDREPLLTQLLDTLVRNQPPPGSPLVNTFAEIALSIWEKIENQPANRVNVISWSGEMLSNVLILCAREGSLDQAAKVMSKLGDQQAYVGEPTIEALCAYVDLCVEKKDFNKALESIKVCKDSGRAEAATMAQDIRNRLELTDEQAQRLSEILL